MSLAYSDEALVGNLVQELGSGSVSTDPGVLAANSHDFGKLVGIMLPIAVVYAERVEDVQAALRLASAAGVNVVPRGAGTGVSGGAHAITRCIVLSLERMNKILEVRADDEVAVVEPGVINSDLNDAVAKHGLMYAPDPASYQRSTIGGNVATNAGGLRCAKYGVTTDSVLGLDVVLADGTLISTGRNTFKGVAGYDLTSLLVGSEGTLGIVVSITVRLRYLSEKTCSIAALFPDIAQAASGVVAIARVRVQPAILELLDVGTLRVLDTQYGSDFSARGGAMLLVRTDGHGAEIEAGIVRSALEGLGARVSPAEDSEAVKLIEMRRASRGDGQDDQYRVGEDIAVPRSAMVAYMHTLDEIARRNNVMVRIVAHAGDGNLHPTFWVDPADGPAGVGRLDAALEESVRAALAVGGTITGEHGVGTVKREWLGWEQSAEVIELQRKIKAVFDPQGLLNPGKAIV